MATSESLKTLPSVTFETQSGDQVTYDEYEWLCVGRSQSSIKHGGIKRAYAIITLARQQQFGKKTFEVRRVIHVYE